LNQLGRVNEERILILKCYSFKRGVRNPPPGEPLFCRFQPKLKKPEPANQGITWHTRKLGRL